MTEGYRRSQACTEPRSALPSFARLTCSEMPSRRSCGTSLPCRFPASRSKKPRRGWRNFRIRRAQHGFCGAVTRKIALRPRVAQRVAVSVETTTPLEEVGELTFKGLTQPVVAHNVPLAATQPAEPPPGHCLGAPTPIHRRAAAAAGSRNRPVLQGRHPGAAPRRRPWRSELVSQP